MLNRTTSIGLICIGLAITSGALYPALHRAAMRIRNSDRLERLETRLVTAKLSVATECLRTPIDLPLTLRVGRLEPQLASWESVGGCGVGGGGASSSGGGVKWVGRSVSGGLLDLQCIGSSTVLEDGTATVVNLRLGTQIENKWVFAANVPMLHKVQEVDVFGETKIAEITGFGDVSLELTRKLGITNASSLTASVAFPNGAYDAVRRGVVLPQQAQLGPGNFSGSMTFEHTLDQMWGLIIAGGNVGYGGGENEIGDYRSPSGSAYIYTGYLLGPFVPSVGLSLTGKTQLDRERFEVLSTQPLYTASTNVTLEWSSDYLALLLGGIGSFSTDGLESWTVALGASASVF